MRTLARPRPGAGAAGEPTASPPGEPGVLLRVALLDAERVLVDLETAHEGLSAADAETRLSRHGPNLLPQAQGPSLARQLLDRRPRHPVRRPESGQLHAHRSLWRPAWGSSASRCCSASGGAPASCSPSA